MLKTAIVAARDRQRLQEIAGILIGFGVNKVVDRLGLRAIRGSPGAVRPPSTSPACRSPSACAGRSRP